MGRLFAWVIFGPWWLKFLAAAGFGWLAFQGWEIDDRDAAARAALIDKAPPAVQPIADLVRNKDPVQEVALRAVLAVEHNTHLTESNTFVPMNEDFMYVLQDEGAGPDQPLVRGVILIEPDQKPAFLAWALTHSVADTETGPVIELDGIVGPSRNTIHVDKVLAKYGLKKAPNFVQVEPFLGPRALALGQPAGQHDQDRTNGILALAAAGLVLMGLVQKLAEPRRRRLPQAGAEAGPTPLSASQIEARLSAQLHNPGPAPAPLSPAQIEARLKRDARPPTPLSAAEIEARLAGPLKGQPQVAARR